MPGAVAQQWPSDLQAVQLAWEGCCTGGKTAGVNRCPHQNKATACQVCRAVGVTMACCCCCCGCLLDDTGVLYPLSFLVCPDAGAVQEDLILPHHLSFYDLIINKARGKSGPLFDFGVKDDIRLLGDASVESQDVHAGKVRWRGGGLGGGECAQLVVTQLWLADPVAQLGAAAQCHRHLHPMLPGRFEITGHQACCGVGSQPPPPPAMWLVHCKLNCLHLCSVANLLSPCLHCIAGG